MWCFAGAAGYTMDPHKFHIALVVYGIEILALLIIGLFFGGNK